VELLADEIAEETQVPEMIYSFAPIIDENSRILVLGSLPGKQSLQKRQYYGNAMNQFWRIVYTVFGESIADESYENRTCFLLEHGVALWDIYHSGEREGSLDKNIRNAVPNDLFGLLKNYPRIERIVIGGVRAKSEYRRLFRDIPIEAVFVPSTSPITGRNVKTFEEKLLIWKQALSLADIDLPDFR
jgi:TDG/mug DNA glycosylase family protein